MLVMQFVISTVDSCCVTLFCMELQHNYVLRLEPVTLWATT